MFYSTPKSGFHTGFFLGVGTFVYGKVDQHGLCHSLLGGSGGMFPQKNFEISPLRVI